MEVFRWLRFLCFCWQENIYFSSLPSKPTISLQPLTPQSSSMMDRCHSALNPGKNAHKHQPHGCYLSCGWASLWCDCALAQRPTHIAITQMLFYCRLLSCCSSTSSFTHKHTLPTLFSSFSLYFCIFISLFSTQFNFSISQWGAEALSAVWSDLPSSLRQSSWGGARGEPRKSCPMCGEQFPLDCDQDPSRSSPHPLRQ